MQREITSIEFHSNVVSASKKKKKKKDKLSSVTSFLVPA